MAIQREPPEASVQIASGRDGCIDSVDRSGALRAWRYRGAGRMGELVLDRPSLGNVVSEFVEQQFHFVIDLHRGGTPEIRFLRQSLPD